jgi:hypothetical protein
VVAAFCKSPGIVEKEMKIANKLERILRQQLKCHVAWLPIANTYALGDYGIVSGGVFTKMGNVQEFGGIFASEKSPPATLDFASANTTTATFVGEAEVQVMPATALNASIRYKFNDAESFLLKAKTVRVEGIGNLNALMKSLKKKKDWERRFHVVRQLWTAEDALVLSSLSAGTEVRIAGDAPALQQLSLGKASTELSLTGNQELGLKLVGKTGAIGLGFAKFGFLFGEVKTLADAEVKGELISVANDCDLTDDL